VRIFAYCANVFFGQLFENHVQKWNNNFGYFFQGKSDQFIFPKTGWATLWAIFWQNPSGHPVADVQLGLSGKKSVSS
jgi:hypothetical protein